MVIYRIKSDESEYIMVSVVSFSSISIDPPPREGQGRFAGCPKYAAFVHRYSPLMP